jgi:PAS domain S-box-containing protein
MRPADLSRSAEPVRASLWVFGAAALLTALALLFVFAAWHEWEQTVQRWHVQLQAIADRGRVAIEGWIVERANDARLIAGIPLVAALAAAPQVTPTSAPADRRLKATVEATLATAVRAEGYQSALLVGSDGRVVAAAGRDAGLDSSWLDMPIRCLAERRQLIDFRIERGGVPLVVAVAPVMVGDSTSPVGAVLLTTDPGDWLYPFLLQRPVLSATEETLLVRRDGDDVLLLSPLRLSAKQPLVSRFPFSAPRLAEAATLQGKGTFGEYRDHRGERVFALGRHLSGTSWVMVVKVDRSEVVAAYLREAGEMGALAAGLALVLGSVGYGAWRRQRSMARVTLARRDARIATLLDQGSDGVLFIAGDGTIAEANAQACRMFGRGRSRLLGVPVRELEKTATGREQSADQLARVEPGRTAVFDAVLVGNDGKGFSGEVSARVVEEDGEAWTLVVVRDVSERKAAERERDRLIEQVRGLARHLSRVEEEFRRRLARELHDRVGQNLAGIALALDLAESERQGATRGARAARIADARRLVEETVEHVRDVMAELRPPLLDDLGLLAALRSYGERVCRRSNLEFAASGDEPVPPLAPEAAVALFRIAQEALANVATHAQAKHVSARLEPSRSSVVLMIEDDGVGFDLSIRQTDGERPFWGLLSMRERAEAIGAAVRVESQPGKGTRVRIEVLR